MFCECVSPAGNTIVLGFELRGRRAGDHVQGAASLYVVAISSESKQPRSEQIMCEQSVLICGSSTRFIIPRAAKCASQINEEHFFPIKANETRCRVLLINSPFLKANLNEPFILYIIMSIIFF